MTDGDGLAGHDGSLAGGLSRPPTGSSSGLLRLFAGAPDTVLLLTLNGSGWDGAMASSDRVSTDWPDAEAGERAFSGTSLSAVDESGESLQAGNRSTSGGQVVRISSAIEAALRRNVLSLGVGIEANLENE